MYPLKFNDYVLRFLVMKGSDLSQAKVMEIAIPEGVIEESDVKDELTLYELLKKYAPKWGTKNQSVRFIVPDSFILLKTFDHPEDVDLNNLREYAEMEIGHSIHLPLKNR